MESIQLAPPPSLPRSPQTKPSASSLHLSTPQGLALDTHSSSHNSSCALVPWEGRLPVALVCQMWLREGLWPYGARTQPRQLSPWSLILAKEQKKWGREAKEVRHIWGI